VRITSGGLEQERFELVVGAVDLVDQQDGPVPGAHRGQQWAFQEEFRAEQLVDGVFVGHLVFRQGADVQQLPGVVPFVERLARVDAFVALQPDELAAEHRRDHLGQLGLAYADLALQQERPVQGQRHEQRRGQPAVSQITAVPQGFAQFADGLGVVHA